MNKFGSDVIYIRFISLIYFIGAILLLVFVESFELIDFFKITILFIAFVLFQVYYAFNGLYIKNDQLVVCNFFIKQRFCIEYNRIERIELVALFKSAYIIIVTKDYEQKKFILKGFNFEDLKKWVSKFQDLDIDIKFTDKR